jgi:hypothetical protein
MRKAVKFLHTLASCVYIGALLAHGLLVAAPPAGLGFAETRAVIGVLGTWLLLPSLAIVVMSGLLSMAVHRPFQELRWVWTKAGLSFLLFLASLHLQGMAVGVATAAARLAPGAGPTPAMTAELGQEGPLLAMILALSVLNIAFGVWRPRLKGRAVR